MVGDPLDGIIAEAVAMLDMGPARKAACHKAASEFDREHGRPRHALTVAVGADHVGWCVWAYGDTEGDIAGLPGTYRGFPVRTGVAMRRTDGTAGAAG